MKHFTDLIDRFSIWGKKAHKEYGDPLVDVSEKNERKYMKAQKWHLRAMAYADYVRENGKFDEFFNAEYYLDRAFEELDYAAFVMYIWELGVEVHKSREEGNPDDEQV